MSKRIVFCSDGTWDNAIKRTNVYRFYKALTLGADQMPFYDEGVGADGNPITFLVGGAFGTGLWEKIKRGYAKIAHVYETGDDLYLLGFSRGAYTARSLAGMIAVVGLPTKSFTDELVETAFSAYREEHDRQEWLDKLKDSNMETPDIKMVGVWDTVGSLGIPAIFGGFDPILYGFLNKNLSPRVKFAFHGLAIDEKRAQFRPTLWDTTPVAGQVIEQVWFTGCHADVGGGDIDPEIDTPSLTDITLGWMIARARALGLTFDQAVLDAYKLPIAFHYSLEKIHESWTALNGVPIHRSIDKNAMLANSVRARCQLDASYRPKPLKFTKGALSKQYSLAVIVNDQN